MIKTKKQSFIIIGVFALVLMLGTVTYAFFNYTRTGTANTIRTGRIAFNSTQGQAINLTNMFPIDVTGGIPSDATKVGTVTINVTGDTTYTEGLEYLVSAVNVTNTVGSKSLPISIDVSVVNNTNNDPATTLGTVDDNYFTDRGGDTSYYKVLAGETINTDDQLVVGYIAPGATGVDGNIVIRAYLDASKIAITDTYDGTESDNMGTTSEWVDDRTVFTTEEWNSLQANGVSFQIKVESNEGIWVKNPNTLYNLMKRSSQGILSDFSETSEQDGTSGVYETTEGVTSIYYYRGAVDNNVIFGDYCWKAVRTTVTGGVKLIYNGEVVNNKCETQTGTGTMINNGETYEFNITKNGEEYVGYTYDNNGVETNSTAKSTIDEWYSNILSNNKIDDDKVETTTYCNDRSYNGPYSPSTYGSYNRLSISSPTPSLNCPNSSDNYNLKVGMLTADEVAYAGGKFNSDNTSYYLYNENNYWLMSPYQFYYGFSYVFYDLSYQSQAVYYQVSNKYGLRPVISLVPGITITGGSGTPTQPYIVG